MVRSTLLPLLLVPALLGAALLALLAPPSTAQGPETEHVTSRYRLCVVRCVLEGDVESAPLRLGELAAEADSVLVPVSAPAREAGYFGAVTFPPGLLPAIRARWPATEVLFRGETEGFLGRQVTITGGRRFPVVTRDVRGDQLISTTKFEKVGVKLVLEREVDFVHEMALEISAVSGWSRGGQPVIFEVASEAAVLLPDGATAVFSYFDRVEGADLSAGPERWLEDEEEERAPDVLVRYFALVTRIDIEKR